MPKFPKQNSGKNLLDLHSATQCCRRGNSILMPLSAFRSPYPSYRSRHEKAILKAIDRLYDDCPGKICLELPGAYHSQRGIPKRPATDRIPAGLLKPFLITAATHDGALLKHPVFHAAPPHCIARHAHLNAVAIHKPVCLAFTRLLACAVNLGNGIGY